MRRSAATARAVTLVAAEAVFLALLVRAPTVEITWPELGTWLDRTPPEDAIVAIARLAGITLGVWLLATTVLYALARATRIPAAIRSIRWLTLPPIRRLLDATIATTLTATLILTRPTGAGAATGLGAGGRPAAVLVLDQRSDPPVYTPIPAGDPAADIGDVGLLPPAYIPTPAGDPTPSTEPLPAQGPAPAPPSSTGYVVQRGDNLWTIAATHLRTTLARDVTNDEIRTYWLQVITENRPQLATGNPDMIHPGEILELPPFEW